MSDLNSGPTRDPIKDLANFGTGGIAVTPLAPDQVRRLGDQRRRRQHVLYAAVAAVVVAVAVVPTALLVTKDDGGSPSPSHQPSVVPDPTPTTFTFPGSGVAVKSEADLAELVGTSDEFKAFIGTVLVQNRTSDCPNAEVDVTKYDSAGFALGDVGGCGGYVALWSIQDGAWKEAIGTQDEWVCGDLTRFSVPDGFAGDCYGPRQLFGPDDDGGLRLGMSADEVRAAGGTVMQGNGCDEVAPQGITSPDGTPLGYLSGTPGRGVIALFAQHDQVTPRGIGLRSTFTEAKQAYPEGHLRSADGSWAVPVTSDVEYRFAPRGGGVDQVISIGLISTTQDCFEDTHP